MLSGKINFLTIPNVGFAHHFYTDKKHFAKYGGQKSIEIVYVKKGTLEVELDEHKIAAQEGSFLILFRHLNIKLYSDGQTPHSHCSMHLLMDYDFELLEKKADLKNMEGCLVVPFVTPPCAETENLKKMLFSAISDVSISREQNELSSALMGLSILQQLSRIYRKQMRKNQDTQSIIEYKIKKYVTQNINRDFKLEDIAEYLLKTPNYLNFVFKNQCGMTIKQYVNQEKVRILCEMLHNREINFQSACESIGISDISYGYRLFKKHTGMTPKEYLFAHKKTGTV